MFLSVILPALFYLLFYIAVGAIALVSWSSGHSNTAAAISADFKWLMQSSFVMPTIYFLGVVWAFSIFSIGMYLWNLFAFFLTRETYFRRKLKPLAIMMPFALWTELRERILKDE